ncbi:hypothetical protein EDF61_10256 [Arthrobacter sp. JUb115]|nr:hypothetical protein EDF61_10256 [Arthrobacter sp. JUb115]
MGTSGSFKGSGGADANSLRDSIASWLDDVPVGVIAPDDPAAESEPAVSGDPAGPRVVPTALDPASLAPIIRLWRRGGGGDGPGGVGSGGAGSGRTAGRSSGGPKRTVGRVAGPAGRASAMARAYATGDSQSLERAGLNYNELRALNDPLEIGKRIADAAFETQPDGSIEDSEARIIVSQLVTWMMAAPEADPRQPDEIVRHTIELMIIQGTINEVGSTIRAEKDRGKRRAVEAEIKSAAAVMASQVTLGDSGTSPTEISQAIESNVALLSSFYEDKK